MEGKFLLNFITLTCKKMKLDVATNLYIKKFTLNHNYESLPRDHYLLTRSDQCQKNDFKVHPQPLKSNSIMENPFGLDFYYGQNLERVFL